MEMWLWQLVLLSVTGMVVSAPTVIILNETSGNKVISKGSSVILHCRLRTIVLEQYRVDWKFNPNGPLENGSQILSKYRKNNSSADTTKDTASHLNEEDSRETLATYEFITSQNNSGWYSCHAQAEIPIYLSNNSNWTHIVVEKSLTPHTTSQTMTKATEIPSFSWNDWWMWVALAGSCLVLVLLVMVCFALRKRHRKRAEMSPIYGNMPPVKSRQPSPRPGLVEDKLDTSYQNLQTPDLSKRYDQGRRLCR